MSLEKILKTRLCLCATLMLGITNTGIFSLNDLNFICQEKSIFFYEIIEGMDGPQERRVLMELLKMAK